MRRALQQRDFEHLRTAAHNLKGTGESYGFPDVTRIGALLEARGDNSELEPT